MKSIPANSKNLRLGAWVLVLLTLFQLGWLQLQPEAGLRTLGVTAANPNHHQPVFLNEEGHRLGAGFKTGNVFLKLVVDPRTNSTSLSSHAFFDYREAYLSEWYYRTSYELYPRRVYLAPSTVIVNDGWDMMQEVFTPDTAWLQAHDVRSILTLGFDDHGRTLPVQWTPFEPAASRTGSPVNGPGGGP